MCLAKFFDYIAGNICFVSGIDTKPELVPSAVRHDIQKDAAWFENAPHLVEDVMEFLGVEMLEKVVSEHIVEKIVLIGKLA